MHLSDCRTGPTRPAMALFVAPLLLLLAGIAPALADHGDERDRDREHRRDRSYEYDDHGCRYEYKEDEDGYKTEYRCRDGSFGADRYRYETEYGGCEYKYEQDRRGYKEELECDDGRPWWADGRGLAPRHGQLPPIARGGPFGIGRGTCDGELIGQAAGGGWAGRDRFVAPLNQRGQSRLIAAVPLAMPPSHSTPPH